MWPRCDELVAAARSGDLVAVRRLLDAGVPVIATDRHMSTALLEATSHDWTAPENLKITGNLPNPNLDPNLTPTLT